MRGQVHLFVAQRGVVLIFALLVLLSLTILAVASVSSALLQHQMAVSHTQQSLVFNAAEAALAKVILESEAQWRGSGPRRQDPFNIARQAYASDPSETDLRCFAGTGMMQDNVARYKLGADLQQAQTGQDDTQVRLLSWSRIAFIQAQACPGSSAVIRSNTMRCHMFVVTGCGQIENRPFAVANALTVSVVTDENDSWR